MTLDLGRPDLRRRREAVVARSSPRTSSCPGSSTLSVADAVPRDRGGRPRRAPPGAAVLRPAAADPSSSPITSPIEFGDELCQDGPFDTLRVGLRHQPDAGRADRRGDVPRGHRGDRAAARASSSPQTLLAPDWRLFFCVLSTPDRVQHMFWRDRDPLHPRHDPGARRAARRPDPRLLPADRRPRRPHPEGGGAAGRPLPRRLRPRLRAVPLVR